MKRKAHNRLELDINYIIKEYREGKSAKNIGKSLGVSKGTILRRLKEQGIKRRKRPKYEEITKDILIDLYLQEKLSSRTIAEMFGCSNSLVLKRLQQFDIPIRKHAGDPAFTAEERKEKWGKSGAEHPRWKGGITAVSNVIRNRLNHVTLERFKIDGFKCVECGGGEHNLNAHHIRPFSEIIAEIRSENGLHDLSSWEAKNKLATICEKDSRLLDLNNLITLCEECHKKVHAGESKLTS